MVQQNTQTLAQPVQKWWQKRSRLTQDALRAALVLTVVGMAWLLGTQLLGGSHWVWHLTA